MSSQIDLDQGGTYRQTQRVYLGPSVGWANAPLQTVVSVTTLGTTTLSRGMNTVLVNVNGLVTIQLPSAKQSAAGPQAIPGSFLIVPVTIIDIGGFAATFNITVLPFGTETIDNLASIPIVSNYGAYVLRPIIDVGGWTLIQ